MLCSNYPKFVAIFQGNFFDNISLLTLYTNHQRHLIIKSILQLIHKKQQRHKIVSIVNKAKYLNHSYLSQLNIFSKMQKQYLHPKIATTWYEVSNSVKRSHFLEVEVLWHKKYWASWQACRRLVLRLTQNNLPLKNELFGISFSNPPDFTTVIF